MKYNNNKVSLNMIYIIQLVDIQVIRNAKSAQSFTIGQSTINVIPQNIEEESKSFSFHGFKTMACIVNEETNW